MGKLVRGVKVAAVVTEVKVKVWEWVGVGRHRVMVMVRRRGRRAERMVAEERRVSGGSDNMPGRIADEVCKVLRLLCRPTPDAGKRTMCSSAMDRYMRGAKG